MTDTNTTTQVIPASALQKFLDTHKGDQVGEIYIPAAYLAANTHLTVGQGVIAYLREELDLPWVEMARAVGKSESTVRTSYARATRTDDPERNDTPKETRYYGKKTRPSDETRKEDLLLRGM